MAGPAVAAGSPVAAAPEGLPPGPRIPASLQGVHYLYRPGPWLEELHVRHGPRVTIRLVGVGTLVLLAEPEDCRRVFTAPDDVLLGGRGNRILEPFLGPSSILLLDGAEHLRQRRLLLPPFHGERMAAYERIVEEVTREQIAGWRPGRRMALQPHLQAITLGVIMRAVFGMRGTSRGRELKALLAQVLDMTAGAARAAAMRFTVEGSPLAPVSRFRRAVRRLDALVYEELAERRRESDLSEREDVLSLLLAARDENGEPMTDLELRDELITLLGAGHETTATSLAWAFERLVRHPAALERLRDELVGGGREYLGATINETLRVRPVLPLTTRQAAVPFALDGLTVPAGTLLTPNIVAVNRRPDAYPEPARFRPERFLGTKPETYGLLSFGGGGRRCLGAAFALMETRVVLATVLGSMRLAPVDRRGERALRRGVSLAPARGATVEVVAG